VIQGVEGKGTCSREEEVQWGGNGVGGIAKRFEKRMGYPSSTTERFGVGLSRSDDGGLPTSPASFYMS